MQFQQIRPPVRVDDKIGGDVRPGRFDKDMHAGGAPVAAFSVPDDPARGVAGCNRPRAGAA